jgi:hypothetical protein
VKLSRSVTHVIHRGEESACLRSINEAASILSKERTHMDECLKDPRVEWVLGAWSI